MKHARRSLQEAGAEQIRDSFDQASGPRPRVLWWDDGGYLDTVIDEACTEIGIEIAKADGNPLKLREYADEEGEEPVLWYVPEARDGREWFRDIKETGDEIEYSIEDLAAQIYDVNRWDIPDPGVAEDDRAAMADILLEELTKPRRRPSLQELQDILILGGHGNPLRRVLQGGWEPDEAERDSMDTLRERLEEEGVPVLDAGDSPYEIVHKVRRWAVAQSLIEAGLPSEAFPSPYNREPSPHGHGAHRILSQTLKEGPTQERAEIYFEPFWEDALHQVEDPWTIANCPVDGALEHRLWTIWLEEWDNEAYETCLERAERRARALEEAYGITSPIGGDDLPWSKAWRQAEGLADLASRLDVWTDKLGDTPVHKLYGDEENGTWQIERAVRNLTVNGTPEQGLPETHPGRERLPELRTELANQGYVDYLEQLAEETATQIRTGEFVDQLSGVRRFWEEHREEFAKGPETIIFYIDALRLDLAYELAERLREDVYQVKSTLWAGILPSETEFGMGALTPGDPHTYEVDLVDGRLRALRNRKTINTSTRENLLENEGWSIAIGPDDGWEKPRVAYFDTEIDDIGENDLDAIEQKLAVRVDQLAEFIATQMERGRWERAFVVADHGFVLLPDDPTFERIQPPDGASDVKRRRVVGKNLDERDAGIILDGQMALTGYLSTPVQVLVNPLQRFRKQAITNSRYYHGGALPQEFILNFLRIDRA